MASLGTEARDPRPEQGEAVTLSDDHTHAPATARHAKTLTGSQRRPSTARSATPARRATTPDLETIVDTAARLFHERGYQNTTMQDLANELNITKPTLYAHARSKLEILGRILDRVLTEAQALVDTAAELGDPLEALTLIIAGQTRLSVTYRAYYGVFQGDQRELPAPLRLKYRRWSRQYVEGVRAVIRQGQALGTFRSDLDSLVTAFAVIGTTNWAARWLRPRGRLSVDEVAAQFTSLVLEGLTGRPSPAPTA